jgi:tetratricopeptide (TPR) repeat protein
MKKNLVILFLFLLGAFVNNAATIPYSAWWQKGNQFYQQKQYDSAAYFYEQIAALKPQNAEVYYNLGTTYYRLNKIGPAVLNFERALRLKPDYKEASENLVLTQSRISNHIVSGSDIFFVSWWQSLTSSKKASTWAIVSLIIFIIVLLCLLAKRFGKDKGRIPPQLIGILSFIWIIFILLAFTAAQNATTSNQAVVMEDNAPLMNNEQKGKPQSLLPEGTKVDVINEKTGWAEVRLADGRSGWIQQTVLTKI